MPATFERHQEDNPTFANYYPEGETRRVTYKEGIFVGYRGYEKNGVKPLFPFGYGLSYTSFKFDNLSVTPEVGSNGPNYSVSFDVTNTGDRSGATLAQVYVADSHSNVPRPLKELKGFKRVMLKRGESQHVSIPLDARAFAYYDTNSKRWLISPGDFVTLVGDSSEEITLKGSVTLSDSVAMAAEE